MGLPVALGQTPLKASLILCTYQRPDDLARCLDALSKQTVQEFEIVQVHERGALAALRNHGARQARTPILCFLDDDVVPARDWLSSVLREFQDPAVMGVTGPAFISELFRQHRDLFRYAYLKRLYDELFIPRHLRGLPGRLTPSGAFTTAAADPFCAYYGPVEYLEACNMSFRAEAFRAVDGFDEAYQGIGDWSEPDLACRLRARYGNSCLRFTPDASVEHRPSLAGAYTLRRTVGARLDNYRLFSRRWVTPSVAHALYWGWLYAYYYAFQPLRRCCGH